MSPRVWTTLSSPLGPIRLVATDRALVAVELPGAERRGISEGTGDGEGAPDSRDAPDDTPGSRHPVLERGVRELEAYFAGDLQIFTVPLALEDDREGSEGTGFQRRVWRGLLTIPYGERRSYGWLAETIGRPGAYRAVGAANGRNPLAIVVPCHRVIGADGSLTGYGGGLEAKRWLLDHEAAHAEGAVQADFFS